MHPSYIIEGNSYPSYLGHSLKNKLELYLIILCAANEDEKDRNQIEECFPSL